MKKPILIMACLLACLASRAQSAKTDSLSNSLKPEAKKLSTELNVNPFNGNVKLNNALNQVKFRLFVTPSVALRLGFNINTVDSTGYVDSPYGTSSYFYKNQQKSTTIGINFGVEKHFEGTRRLSPYIGADLFIANRSSHQTIQDNASTTTVTNAWLYSYSSGNYVYQSAEQNAYFRYGATLLTGFDFYIARHFFCGYEFDLNLSKTNYKDAQAITTGQSTPNDFGKYSTFTLNTSLMNGIRIGYTF